MEILVHASQEQQAQLRQLPRAHLKVINREINANFKWKHTQLYMVFYLP